jgi:uncharacterized protein (TIGR02284 family)
MASQYADIPALNHIIAILIDATRLYRRAVQLAGGAAAEPIQRTLDGRQRLMADMQARVRALGGKPSGDGSMLGAAHKAFLNVRSVFDRDLNAALAEVERGEDYLATELRKCMRREDVSADTRAFFGVALDRVISGEELPEAVQREHRVN